MFESYPRSRSRNLRFHRAQNQNIFQRERLWGIQFKGGWKFSGGKIEAGGTKQQTVVRVIREKLDSVQWFPADVTLIDKIRGCMLDRI